MPGGMTPELYRHVLELHRDGKRAEALAAYNRLLPLINYEHNLCGLRATKILLKEAGIIRSDAVREPASMPMTPEIRAGLLEIARGLDPFAFRFK